MRLQEALDKMLEGKGVYVRRTTWVKDCGYLAILPGLTHPLRTVTQPNVQTVPWAPSIDDMIATDWEVVEMPTTVLEAVADAA